MDSDPLGAMLINMLFSLVWNKRKYRYRIFCALLSQVVKSIVCDKIKLSWQIICYDVGLLTSCCSTWFPVRQPLLMRDCCRLEKEISSYYFLELHGPENQ